MRIRQLAAATLLSAAVAGAAGAAAPALAAQAAPVNGSLATALPGASTALARVQATQDNASVQITNWARSHVQMAEQAARAAAAAKRAAAQQARAAATAAQPLTAGMSSFEQCVAYRESTDTPTDPDGLFGILPSTWASLGYSGTAGQASVAQQKVAFSRLYAMYGTQPWAPSDGC